MQRILIRSVVVNQHQLNLLKVPRYNVLNIMLRLYLLLQKNHLYLNLRLVKDIHGAHVEEVRNSHFVMVATRRQD